MKLLRSCSKVDHHTQTISVTHTFRGASLSLQFPSHHHPPPAAPSPTTLPILFLFVLGGGGRAQPPFSSCNRHQRFHILFFCLNTASPISRSWIYCQNNAHHVLVISRTTTKVRYFAPHPHPPTCHNPHPLSPRAERRPVCGFVNNCLEVFHSANRSVKPINKAS